MKTSIIFEGGGMRGAFTCGVIDYLIEQDIRFDAVYGVSAGAIHACSYLTHQKGRAYMCSTEFAGEKRFASLESYRRTGNYFNVNFMYHEIPEQIYPLDHEAFLKSGMKFKVVVTDCVTGEAAYPEVRDLMADMDYIRASGTLPVLSKMVPIDGRCYLDGGIADSIPLRQAERDGYERNVVVLTQPIGYEKKPELATMPFIRAKFRRYPKLVEALSVRHKVYNATLDEVYGAGETGRAFLIAPMGPLDIGRAEMDHDKLRKGYQEGYFVAEGLGDRLKAFLAEAKAGEPQDAGSRD